MALGDVDRARHQALVAHPGTQSSYRLAHELHALGALAGFHTGIALAKDGLLATAMKRVPERLRRAVENRTASVPAHLLHSHPLPELVAQARLRRGGVEQAILHERNEAFQRAIPDVSIRAASAVVGFDTSGWILAQRARDLAVPMALVATTGHPDGKITIFEQMRERYPEWRSVTTPRLPVVRRAEQTEFDLASVIVTASSFCKQTLVEHGVSPSKIQVNPYGVDSHQFPFVRRSRGDGPVRLLYCGVLSAQKGVPLLLEAWRRLNPQHAELRLAGPASQETIRLISHPSVKYIGQVAHGALPAVFQQSDAFVFPTHFDGFGLVILEAMSSGLPVIATPSSGAPDLYENGDGGWIVPSGDSDGLCTALEECLQSPQRLDAMGRRARDLAERFSWSSFGERWAGILETSCKPRQEHFAC